MDAGVEDGRGGANTVTRWCSYETYKEWLNGQAYELRGTKAIIEQERREPGQPQAANHGEVHTAALANRHDGIGARCRFPQRGAA